MDIIARTLIDDLLESIHSRQVQLSANRAILTASPRQIKSIPPFDETRRRNIVRSSMAYRNEAATLLAAGLKDEGQIYLDLAKTEIEVADMFRARS